jgi:hypothetical protein
MECRCGEAPASIDGLWSIGFGMFQGGDADTMYVTADIRDERQGLLGKITVVRGRRDRRTRRSIGRRRTSGRPRVMSLTGMQHGITH